MKTFCVKENWDSDSEVLAHLYALEMAPRLVNLLHVFQDAEYNFTVIKLRIYTHWNDALEVCNLMCKIGIHIKAIPSEWTLYIRLVWVDHSTPSF
jgi:hypothetical protein